MLFSEEKTMIREGIVRELEAIRKTITSLRDQVRPIELDGSIGRVTRIDAIQQKSMYEANLRAAEIKQDKLEAALKRIEAPDFGFCERCHQPIPAARILAIPEARRCVHCAERL